MKALEIIQMLCQIGNTEQCGIYFHDSYEGLRDFFGPHAAIQYCDGRENLLRGREYVYDYKCEISDEPNALIFPEDLSSGEEEPIGLYLIEYPGE